MTVENQYSAEGDDAQDFERWFEATYKPDYTTGPSFARDWAKRAWKARGARAHVQPKGTPSLDDIYKAWHTIGADVAGLSWSRFVELLPSHVPSQETKE